MPRLGEKPKPTITKAEIIKVDALPEVNIGDLRMPALVTKAQSISITDDDSYARADAFRSTLKSHERCVEDRLGPIIKAAHATHKQLTAMRGELLKPSNDALIVINNKMTCYHNEKERAAELERRQREAEEQERLNRQRQAEVAALKNAGQVSAARELLNDDAPLARVEAAPVKFDTPVSSSVRKSWDFRVVDPLKIPREYLVVDEAAIRRIVTSQGAAAAKMIAGIEVYEKTTIASRRS